jgi:hypothetical protein
MKSVLPDIAKEFLIFRPEKVLPVMVFVPCPLGENSKGGKATYEQPVLVSGISILERETS